MGLLICFVLCASFTVGWVLGKIVARNQNHRR